MTTDSGKKKISQTWSAVLPELSGKKGQQGRGSRRVSYSRNTCYEKEKASGKSREKEKINGLNKRRGVDSRMVEREDGKR